MDEALLACCPCFQVNFQPESPKATNVLTRTHMIDVQLESYIQVHPHREPYMTMYFSIPISKYDMRLALCIT